LLRTASLGIVLSISIALVILANMPLWQTLSWAFCIYSKNLTLVKFRAAILGRHCHFDHVHRMHRNGWSCWQSWNSDTGLCLKCHILFTALSAEGLCGLSCPDNQVSAERCEGELYLPSPLDFTAQDGWLHLTPDGERESERGAERGLQASWNISSSCFSIY
jgi:hypothetical protein